MSNDKLLVRIYSTYGKGDGEELCEQYDINDTKEERQDVVDSVSFGRSYDAEGFIEGRLDEFAFDRYGGDWDEPTGGYVVAYTRDGLIESIKSEAQREIDRINKLFEE